MRLVIDTDRHELVCEADGRTESLDLYSRQAFERVAREYVRLGWNQKYSYTFSWLGRPIIQLPDDMVRMQEVLFGVAPDVLVETGVAHGGSLVFYASLFCALGKGRVVGVDIEIRPHNRRAIEAHPLSSRIELVEGSSTAPAVVERVAASIAPGERVMVVLDSSHTKRHVLDECEAYAPLVSAGSYLVVTDGLMRDVADTPRGRAEWRDDNPAAAAEAFARAHPEFVLEAPRWSFNESELDESLAVTHWPSAWLRREAA